MKYSLGNTRGKPLLAEAPDPHKGRTIRAYYINSDTEVQLHDGTDSWIITVGTCLPGMKLAEKIAALHGGNLPPRPRRHLVDDDEPDRFCITTPDGNCVSEDPRCMHNKQATVDEGGAGIRRRPRRRIHVS